MRPSLSALLLSLLLSPAAHAQGASFQGLGVLPGHTVSIAEGVSADGRVVVGRSIGDRDVAFRWTEALAMEPLFDNADIAVGASADGRVVVGGFTRPAFAGAFVFEAYRWEGGVVQPLGDLPGPTTDPPHLGVYSEAFGVSDDGRVVVGQSTSEASGSSSNEAFRWEGGMAPLGDLPGGGFGSRAQGVSADGSVVVGWSASASGLEAFRWTAATRMVGLNDLDGGASRSQAFDVSADGRVVVGGSSSAFSGAGSVEAFRWTEAGGMVGLRALPGHTNSTATGASADGRVVVGLSGFLGEAFVWTEADGMRRLRDVLVDLGLGGVLTGWTLGEAVDVSADGTVIVGNGRSPSGRTEGWRAVLAPNRGGIVRDVNRFGAPGPALAGVVVTASVGGVVQASDTTDASGRFSFDAPTFDPTLLYDVALDGSFAGVGRAYAAVRPSELADTSLVLPAELHRRLDFTLGRLEDTDPLVLGYDVTTARALLALWNTLEPETASTHRDRDLALARLFVAAEAMEEVYRATDSLAFETGEITVAATLSAIATTQLLRELGQDAAAEVAGGLAQGTVSEQEASLAMEFLLAAIGLANDALQSLIESSVEGVLPGEAATVYTAATGAVAASVIAALESGRWGDDPDGRGALLAELAETLAVEAGKRIVATSYVMATQDDLDGAVTRSRSLDGTGPVQQAFARVQTRVAEVVDRNGTVLAASEAARKTAEGWQTVGEVSRLVGRVPGAQLAAVLGTVVQALSTGTVVSATVADYFTLYRTAEEDVPSVILLSFEPLAPRPTGPDAGRRGRRVGGPYASHLGALRARVAAGDRAGALEAAGRLVTDEDTLRADLERTLLSLAAVAERARAVRPEFEPALVAALAAAGRLAGERVGLYNAVAAYAASPLAADPPAPPQSPYVAADSVLARAPRVEAALGAFEAAAAAAASASAGLTAPALVLVAEHEADPDSVVAGRPFSLRVRIVNAGMEPADGVVATLVAEGGRGEAPVLSVLSEATLAVGRMEAGTASVLTWEAVARDTLEVEAGSVGRYRVEVTAAAGRTRSTRGALAVYPSGVVATEPASPSEPPTHALHVPSPNPSAGRTSLAFTLAEASRARLAVYDVLGREVAVLVDRAQAAGRHEATLDAGRLAPGVYIVRLTAGDATASRRLTVAR